MVEDAYKEELYRRFDALQMAQECDERRVGRSIERFIGELDSPDAEDYYLWGFSIYLLNEDDALVRSAEKFSQALNLCDSLGMARLYLAHCYHDMGNYAEALTHYLQVDQQWLAEDMPIWRVVKLNEQIGFCYAQLGQMEKAVAIFEVVLDSYVELDGCELVPIQEAYDCLPRGHALIDRLKEAEAVHFASELEDD
ncbi:MAG: tetratricopeptide repeat protein [Gammaproteobacteria bacterium]